MTEFCIGDQIRVVALPAYLKTAEPLPSLKSSAVLSVGELGTVVDRRPGGYWSVRFASGAYLLESQYLAAVE
jgi:Protein of unknown function (DUF3148)